MRYDDTYVILKLESCFLEGTLVCVCGMPSRPVSIFVHDGGYYAHCSTCSQTLSVDYMVSLSDTPFQTSAVIPGVHVDYKHSDIAMTLWCLCGAQSCVNGKNRGEIACSVCKLTYQLNSRLAIRALPRGSSLDSSCSNSEPPNWQPSKVYNLEEECSEKQDPDAPDISEQVAAFKQDRLMVWAKLLFEDWNDNDLDY